MKESSTNSFQYSGIARVHLTQKGKEYSFTVHNQGTDNLGNFFMKSLSGYYSTNIDAYKSDRPQWFSFEYEDAPGNWIPLIKSVVPFTGTTYGNAVNSSNDPTGTIAKVQFTAAIPTSAVIRRSNLNGKAIRMVMWNNNIPKQPLAFIQGVVNSADTIGSNIKLLYEALRSGQDAVVDWIMYILNKVE